MNESVEYTLTPKQKKEIELFITDPEKEATVERLTKFDIYQEGDVIELRWAGKGSSRLGSELIVSYNTDTGEF